MAVQSDHVKNVCQPGTILCCRYLMVDRGGFVCAKVEPKTKAYLDARVVAGTMNAVCDNCDGVARP
jgi:hypothetical protein